MILVNKSRRVENFHALARDDDVVFDGLNRIDRDFESTGVVASKPEECAEIPSLGTTSRLRSPPVFISIVMLYRSPSSVPSAPITAFQERFSASMSTIYLLTRRNYINATGTV